MKVLGMAEAVAATASSEYTTPIKLPSNSDASLCVEDVWVDIHGGMWFKAVDGSAVVIARKDWETVSRFIGFAEKKVRT